MAKPTYRDIADATGFSQTTVHRVLTGQTNVAPETRDRIIHEAAVLGYKPPTGNLIGLIVPDSSNPFFSELGYRFEVEFSRRGLHLLVSSSEGKPGREYALVERFVAFGAVGLIYISTSARKDSILR